MAITTTAAWSDYYKTNLNKRLHDSILRLCQDNLPRDIPLLVDGIICVTASDSSEIVVKVHETVNTEEVYQVNVAADDHHETPIQTTTADVQTLPPTVTHVLQPVAEYQRANYARLQQQGNNQQNSAQQYTTISPATQVQQQQLPCSNAPSPHSAPANQNAQLQSQSPNLSPASAASEALTKLGLLQSNRGHKRKLLQDMLQQQNATAAATSVAVTPANGAQKRSNTQDGPIISTWGNRSSTAPPLHSSPYHVTAQTHNGRAKGSVAAATAAAAARNAKRRAARAARNRQASAQGVNAALVNNKQHSSATPQAQHQQQMSLLQKSLLQQQATSLLQRQQAEAAVVIADKTISSDEENNNKTTGVPSSSSAMAPKLASLLQHGVAGAANNNTATAKQEQQQHVVVLPHMQHPSMHNSTEVSSDDEVITVRTDNIDDDDEDDGSSVAAATGPRNHDNTTAINSGNSIAIADEEVNDVKRTNIHQAHNNSDATAGKDSSCSAPVATCNDITSDKTSIVTASDGSASDNTDRYSCLKCDINLTSFVFLNIHNKAVHNQLTCKNCLLTFDTHNMLTAHSRHCIVARDASKAAATTIMTAKINNASVAAQQSSIGTSNTDGTTAENSDTTTATTTVECDECGREFSDEAAWQTHLCGNAAAANSLASQQSHTTDIPKDADIDDDIEDSSLVIDIKPITEDTIDSSRATPDVTMQDIDMRSVDTASSCGYTIDSPSTSAVSSPNSAASYNTTTGRAATPSGTTTNRAATPNSNASTPGQRSSKRTPTTANSRYAALEQDDNVNHTCKECSIDIHGYSAYSKHCLDIHNRYACAKCSRTFTTRNNMWRHARNHSNEREWVCSQCSKAFMRSDILQEHTLTHTSNYMTGKCWCGEVIQKKSSLLHHLKKCLTLMKKDQVEAKNAGLFTGGNAPAAPVAAAAANVAIDGVAAAVAAGDVNPAV